MKRICIVLIVIVLGVTNASAATKPVSVRKIEILTTAPEAEGFLISGKTLVTWLNTSGANSNISLTGLDLTGQQIWQRVIDSGVDEAAFTSTVDAQGNIWLAGAAAPMVALESATAQVIADNPDSVVVEPVSKFRGDLNQLTIWKVSSTGDLLATYSLALKNPPLASAISVNSTGIAVVGQLDDKPFLISASLQGVFTKEVTIGSSKTTLNAVLRNSDGTVSAFGSSSEPLAGKKLVGIRDGILVKFSKGGAVVAVVRSSAPKADRSWLSTSQSLALTGSVKSGRVIESAFTQFNSAFGPTWTLRIPSTGYSTVISNSNSTYGAISSNSAVTGISGWKPVAPSLLLIKFDSKGIIRSAFGSAELSKPIALAYSKEAGIFGLAKSANQIATIFTLGAE